jgi:hydroxymethylglutaryl-CoA lyase
MIAKKITIISLADTVGIAEPEQISKALGSLIPQYPTATIGVHLHSTPYNWKEKLEAAVNAGCRRIDGAIRGVGGCPMAGNELVGNMNTELILSYLEKEEFDTNIDQQSLQKSIQLAAEIFS